MKISRTPFRVSFLGGGTDLPWWYQSEGGAFISCAINQYMYLSGHPMFNSNTTLLKYSRTEEVDHPSLLQHPIAREVLTYFNASGLDISVTSDIPSGTGLGSSSSFTVGLIRLVAEMTQNTLGNDEIAKLACHIEIDVLGEPIGVQDQYAASFGGLRYYEIARDGTVTSESLISNESELDWLNSAMFLIFTDSPSRSASDMLRIQHAEITSQTARKEALGKLHELTKAAKDVIRVDIRALGELVRQGWEMKKNYNSTAETSEVAKVIEIARRNGSLGEKLLGAGGGGFVLSLVEPAEAGRMVRALEPMYKVIPIGISKVGSQLIYDSQTFAT